MMASSRIEDIPPLGRMGQSNSARPPLKDPELLKTILIRINKKKTTYIESSSRYDSEW
jgi:hypothetical protein